MSGGARPKSLSGSVLYLRTLEATVPLYRDLSRIGIVEAKSAAPGRNRRRDRSQRKGISSWYGTNVQVPAETNVQVPAEVTAVAERVAIPKRLAGVVRGYGAISQARSLGITRSDLGSAVAGNHWQQGISAIDPGRSLAVAVRGARASVGWESRSGRHNKARAFTGLIDPRLQGPPLKGPQARPTAMLNPAAFWPTKTGPFAPSGMAVGKARDSSVEQPIAWPERVNPLEPASRSWLSSNPSSLVRDGAPSVTADLRGKADHDHLLDLLAERASRPPRGVTGVDPRLGPTYPGGFGRQW